MLLILRCVAILCVTALAAAPQNAPRWRMKYFYDRAKSELVIADLVFPSATRGIAVGALQEGTHFKPVMLNSSDGGATWTQSPLQEMPTSLFFLNDSLGWMATEKNVWITNEGGRDWQKLSHPPAPVLRLWFWDENRGIAAGLKKGVFQTSDGGKKWTPVSEAAKPAGAPDRSAYNWIAFANQQFGLICGFNQPVSRWSPMFPAWLDPEEALSRRETPHLAYTLSTNDGGKTWASGSASLLGRITRVRFGPDGSGLGLIEYGDSFNYSSEVYRINWKTGKSQTLFRDKKLVVTDIWVDKDGVAYLAGVEANGELRSLTPGRVKVFRSLNYGSFTPIPVDYRAEARRVIFAGGPAGMWLATDSGMILKLE
jgi:photosystem II stability/assembly factor-like uncharacterized protein